MTLIELTNKIKMYAESQYNHPKAMEGSVYTNLNTKELTYPCINIDNVNVVKRDNEVVYSYYVYYADRLNEDGSNTLQIQSEATTSLELILNRIAESGAMNLDEIPNVIITPYKMKFTDMCAGAWMQVSIHTLNGIDYCNEGGTRNTLYITANGTYDTEIYDGVIVDVPQYLVGDDWFYFKSRQDGSKVGFHLKNGDPFNVNFEYSRDKIEWTEWDFSPLTVNSGESVYFRGDNANGFKPNPAQGPEYYFTTPSGSFNIGGDIRTLIAKVELPNTPPQYCFRYFFNDCSIVEVDKKMLSGFSILSAGCFADLFTNCRSLTKAPELPYMILAGECYRNLFNECRALETAPELPAKTIGGGSYENMFHNCKNLTYVKCLATSGLSNAKNMTSGVNATGVFIKDYAADWSGVQNGIPSGWTVKENEVELVDTSITENGTYTAQLGKGFRNVSVNVDQQGPYQSGYTSGYTDGYASGNTDGYQSGYTSGHTDGYREGYTSGTTEGFQSGFTSGYTSGYTNGYQSGYTDGEESVPLSSKSIVENGTYTKPRGGWNSVTVNVPTSGITPTGSITINDNGTYDVTNKATAIVAVPTGITPTGSITITGNGTYDVTDDATATVEVPVEDYYNSGYTEGFQSGYTSGHTAGFAEGYASGRTDGFNEGYSSGHTDGFNEGYDSGHTDGYSQGYQSGTSDGYQSGYTEGFASGYTSGRTDGYAEGYASGHTAGYAEGYTSGRTDGFNEGYTSGRTDGFQSGYTSGYTDGYASGRTDGYASGYTSGYTDGVASVPLTSTGFTENGVYTKAQGGWNNVTVNVPKLPIRLLTQAEYDALTTKDPNIVYVINN